MHRVLRNGASQGESKLSFAEKSSRKRFAREAGKGRPEQVVVSAGRRADRKRVQVSRHCSGRAKLQVERTWNGRARQFSTGNLLITPGASLLMQAAQNGVHIWRIPAQSSVPLACRSGGNSP